jgi:hypothetical protein
MSAFPKVAAASSPQSDSAARALYYILSTLKENRKNMYF